MGNELREWYKEHGICTICHHENALNGCTRCGKNKPERNEQK